jgi:3-oxoadipate enol-lactonase
MVSAGTLRQVPLGPTHLAYRCFGPPAGSATLLLHPWFGCWSFWEPVLTDLQDRRCLVADLYSPAAGDWREVNDASSLASALVTLLNAEGADRAAVVGNSMGGILAQLVAAQHPQLVEKLVLVGTGASSSRLHSQFSRRLKAWLATREPSQLEVLTRGLVAPRSAQDALVDECVKALADVDGDYIAAIPRATLRLDLHPLLKSIRAATLVIRGELDSIRTRRHAQELAGGIAGARLVEIPGAGHSPMVDSPATFNRLLIEFLDA